MKRRALIIFCDNTGSGPLNGPYYDNESYVTYLLSHVGGEWYEEEICSLYNPTIWEVSKVVNSFMSNADYTFIVFSGHGCINMFDKRQYLELMDGDISLLELRTTAPKQTLIIDACRGYYELTSVKPRLFSKAYESFIGDVLSTRKIFDSGIKQAEGGWTILYAASEDQSALDTNNGGAYLISLLEVAEVWHTSDKKYNILPLNITHEYAINYLSENFETIQLPVMNKEKRKTHFPFAVKVTHLRSLNG